MADFNTIGEVIKLRPDGLQMVFNIDVDTTVLTPPFYDYEVGPFISHFLRLGAEFDKLGDSWINYAPNTAAKLLRQISADDKERLQRGLFDRLASNSTVYRLKGAEWYSDTLLNAITDGVIERHAVDVFENLCIFILFLFSCWSWEAASKILPVLASPSGSLFITYSTPSAVLTWLKSAAPATASTTQQSQ